VDRIVLERLQRPSGIVPPVSANPLQASVVQGIDLSPEAALKAGLWPWDHGDPVDRALAAIAASKDLALVHTDKRLSQFEGFPQRYFPGLR